MFSVRYPASQNQLLHPVIRFCFSKGTLLLPSLTDISLDSYHSSLYREDEPAGFPVNSSPKLCV